MSPSWGARPLPSLSQWHGSLLIVWALKKATATPFGPLDSPTGPPIAAGGPPTHPPSGTVASMVIDWGEKGRSRYVPAGIVPSGSGGITSALGATVGAGVSVVVGTGVPCDPMPSGLELR